MPRFQARFLTDLLPRAQGWIFALWAAAAFSGWIILMIPEEPRQPLVSKDDWRIEGGFFENWRPDKSDLHNSILNSPDVRFFRSWSPETGPTTGRIETAPFPVPRYLGIPLSGSAYLPGISVSIECLESSDRLPLATGHLQGGWTEQILPIPADWCKSDARVIAESKSKVDLICAGTPFAASRLAYLKGSAPVIVFAHAVVLMPLAVIACALALQLLVWRWAREMAVMGAAVGVCLWGYVSFFVAYFDPRLQIMLSMLTLLLCGLSVFQRRAIAVRELGHDEVRRPLTVFFAVAVSAVLAVYAIETGSGAWTPNYRFAPPLWSSDNHLQPMISEMLYRGQSVLNWNAFWQTSDRPPLLSGVLLLSRPWWESILAVHDNKRLIDLFFQCAAISIMAFWVVPVWYLIQKLRLSRWRKCSVFILFASTPFIIFNTVYTSPKLLAGWLGVIAYLLIIQGRLDTGRRVAPATLILGGAAATLALLSHGGVVFGLLPVAVLMLTPRFWPGWRPLLLGAVVAIALLAPWTTWQNLVDPPGNHLVKSAFADTLGKGEDDISVWETVIRRYKQMSVQEWAETRWAALGQLFVGWDPPGSPSPLSIDSPDRMRGNDMLFVVPSLRVLILGWLPLIATLIAIFRVRRVAPSDATALLMAGLGTVGFLISCLTTFPPQAIHHNSYLSMILLILGLATAISSLADRRLVVIVIFVQIVYMSVVWGIAPLDISVNNRLDVMAGWALAAGLAAERTIVGGPNAGQM